MNSGSNHKMNESLIQNYQQQVESALRSCFYDQCQRASIADTLSEAMAYSLFNGGKRLRGMLVYAGATSISPAPPFWLLDRAAAAVECIHAYSLIHDDLPAMDDDDLRRGKPSAHIQFGEALAILAGDALQTLAFEMLAQPYDSAPSPQAQLPSSYLQCQLQSIQMLSHAAGGSGMVSGQVFDIQGVNRPIADIHGKQPDDPSIEADLAYLTKMHDLKTGALIQAALRIGANIANLATSDAQQPPLATTVSEQLANYGHHLGLAFQIQDDILDIEGQTARLGKPAGSDSAANKLTYPSIIGLANSKVQATEHFRLAELAATQLPEPEPLLTILQFLVKRDF